MVDRRFKFFPMLAFSIASAGCGGSEATSTGTPISTPTPVLPGAPTIGAAVAGDATASIAFAPPSVTGSSAISGYSATCAAAAGSRVGTASASPVAVAGLTNGTTYSCAVTATNAAGTSAPSGSVSVTPVAAAVASVDLARLPVGDSFVRTTSAGVGYAFMCSAGNPGAGGATAKGPWFNADGLTWNSLSKLVVSGVVTWVSNFAAVLSGNTRNATGNGLPAHTTGTFPVPASDPVYAYDRNPNSISAQAIAWGLPGNPVVNSIPTCLNGGAIGVLLTGVRLFAPTDALNRDAVAWEAQDNCQGHPERSGQYHYHSISSCLSQGTATRDAAGQHSPLVGYAADGFGIYGNLGEGGIALTNAALDECHGHTHAVTISGAAVVQYHYHKAFEFPYALGCYRGTPATVN